MFYAAHLFLHPPEHPLHGVDLVARIPEFYCKQLGLPEIVDPATGKSTVLSSDARLQERSLALDDAESMRALLRTELKLEATLDSEDASEAEKKEALGKLLEIGEFQREHGRRSIDAAQRTARTVREALYRLHRHLSLALDEHGQPHPVLRPLALHIQNYILIPSARYSGHGGRHARACLAGSFTYEPPPGVSWTD